MTNVLVSPVRKQPAMFHKWICLSLGVQLVIAIAAVWFAYKVRSGRFSADTEVPPLVEWLLYNAIDITSGIIFAVIFFLILIPIAILFRKKKISLRGKVCTEFLLSLLFSFVVGSKLWAYGTFLVIFNILPQSVPFIHKPEVPWLLALGSGLTAIFFNYIYSYSAFRATQ